MRKVLAVAFVIVTAFGFDPAFDGFGRVRSQQTSPNLSSGRSKQSLPSQDQMAVTSPAVSPKKILIYGPSMVPFAPNEQSIATAQGHIVTVADAATWSSFTTADFKQFDALVFGDPDCVTGTFPLATAEANRAVWSAAATGPKIVAGNDPIFHIIFSGLPGARKLIENAINFAASGPGTGLYVSLSCYYFSAPPGTQVELLSSIGIFRTSPQLDCPDTVTIVQPSHPAMIGLTNADLSNWSCSVHEFLPTFPAGFSALATSNSLPYIIAAGPSFDICIQDDSSGSTLGISLSSGAYFYESCGGFSLAGAGTLTIKGNVVTLQHNQADRRVKATIDRSVNKATASIQIFPQGATFTITDRNITNNTCVCP